MTMMKTTAKLSKAPTVGHRSVTGRQPTAVLGVHQQNHHFELEITIIDIKQSDFGIAETNITIFLLIWSSMTSPDGAVDFQSCSLLLPHDLFMV